jgi:hypothetical protein
MKAALAFESREAFRSGIREISDKNLITREPESV